MNELEILKNKIIKVIDLVEKLHDQNQKLKQENLVIRQQLKALTDSTSQLQNEEATSVEQAQIIKDYQQKYDKIRIKIKQILEKLESFEKLSDTINNQ
ncbi:MAG TPA: hypothetical protein ENN22_06980 [bacterium]|nr:hypothetical protein [bacterium]